MMRKGITYSARLMREAMDKSLGVKLQLPATLADNEPYENAQKH